MASHLLKLQIQSFNPKTPPPYPQPNKPFFSSLPFSTLHHRCRRHDHCFQISHTQKIHSSKPSHYPSIHSSLSSSSSATSPPSSKEEAILQAKTCLAKTIEKPLNNPKLAGKLKKLKQPRFRIEIPLFDDTPSSLSQLAFEFFQDIPIKRKESPIKFLLLWPNNPSTESANQLFKSSNPNSNSSNPVENIDLSSISDDNTRILSSTDVAVFMTPEEPQLETIKKISEILYPKSVVMFNPKWGFEDEDGFGELRGFVGSFEVVYSFMGLEVKGILSKRKGMVFRCVRDGVVSGEKWNVMVEEEDGEMKVVSKFKSRPSIGEVENVLYNLMAINSPITKSAKFLRDLVSNVTGKK